MLPIVVLLLFVVVVAAIDYVLAVRLSDGIGSWARER